MPSSSVLSLTPSLPTALPSQSLFCTPTSSGQNLRPPRVQLTDVDWAEKFIVPWNKLSVSLLKPLTEGTRPNPGEKRGIVKFVVDEIKKISANADMEQTRQIAKKIVATYPKSFEDRGDEGEKLGCGYYTMAKYIKTRIEYTNRGDLSLRLRQVKSKKAAATSCTGASNRSTTEYGCIQWQPRHYPESETAETLQAKRAELVALAESQGTTLSLHKDTVLIDAHMKATYIIQRQIINSNPPIAIEEIKAQFPFLFVERWLFQHFQQLVGKPPYATLRESLASKGNRMLMYFVKEGDVPEARMVERHHQVYFVVLGIF